MKFFGGGQLGLAVLAPAPAIRGLGIGGRVRQRWRRDRPLFGGRLCRTTGLKALKHLGFTGVKRAGGAAGSVVLPPQRWSVQTRQRLMEHAADAAAIPATTQRMDPASGSRGRSTVHGLPFFTAVR